MKSSNVTIVGVCRNLGSNVNLILKQVEVLGMLFKYSNVIFVEGDSSDNTRQLLNKWANKSINNRTIISTPSLLEANESQGYFKGMPLPREGRITFARNIVLDQLKSTDYVISIDLDIIGWDLHGIVNSFSRKNWDVMYWYRHNEPPYIQDCEHVIFNECIRKKNNASIYTNPKMKLWYGGYLDIKFVIHGPLDLSDIRVEKFEKVVIEEYIDPSKELESETGTYELQFKPTESGTYGICLDNRQSSFLKEVSLDVRLAPRPAPVAIQSGGEPGISEEEQTVTRIQESLARINKGLNKLMIKQLGDRHRLDLHKETNVMSHKEVVRWFSSRHTSGSKQRA
eukprot:gene17041-22550_t